MCGGEHTRWLKPTQGEIEANVGNEFWDGYLHPSQIRGTGGCQMRCNQGMRSDRGTEEGSGQQMGTWAKWGHGQARQELDQMVNQGVGPDESRVQMRAGVGQIGAWARWGKGGPIISPSIILPLSWLKPIEGEIENNIGNEHWGGYLHPRKIGGTGGGQMRGQPGDEARQGDWGGIKPDGNMG